MPNNTILGIIIRNKWSFANESWNYFFFWSFVHKKGIYLFGLIFKFLSLFKDS